MNVVRSVKSGPQRTSEGLAVPDRAARQMKEANPMKLTRPVPMWQQVADHVRDQILDGTYPAGQPLPSEEALAAEFGVSRPTIREGIKALVAEGLVQVTRPRGTIVLDPFSRP